MNIGKPLREREVIPLQVPKRDTIPAQPAPAPAPQEKPQKVTPRKVPTKVPA